MVYRNVLFLTMVYVLLAVFVGCKSDESTVTVPPSTQFTANPSSVSVAPSGSTTATLSGGTSPYTLQDGPDTTIATAMLSGSTLTITGVGSGYTSVTILDGASTRIRVGISITGPITYDLFPLTLGRQYTYAGYAISTGGVALPDPSNVYRTSWTLIPYSPPLPTGFVGILDTTTLHITSDTTVVRVLGVSKFPNGDYYFLQTLGPFFRAFGINRPDTLRAIPIAAPRVGIGGTWTGYDSTYTSPQGAVRLEIIGLLESGESITDSSASHTEHDVLRFRTYRRISLGGSVIVDNATTSRLWLQRDIGPIQVLIAQDTENLGQFRVLKSKNF